MLAPELETIYLGGGTPSFLEPRSLEVLLRGLPRARGATVEANPETVTPALAELLVNAGVNRDLARRPELPAAPARGAGPPRSARRRPPGRRHSERCRNREHLARSPLRNPRPEPAAISTPIWTPRWRSRRSTSLLRAGGEARHPSTSPHGAELRAQAERLEDHLERVVERLTGAGYRWYETANFARTDSGRIFARRTISATGSGATTWASGSAPSRRSAWSGAKTSPRCPATSGRWSGERSRRARSRQLDEATKLRERLMLGLRLDEPLAADRSSARARSRALDRFSGLGLIERDGESITLSRRGRMLGGAVSAELIVWPGDSLAA